MRLTKRIASGLLLVCVLLAGCTEKHQPVLRIGTNLWIGYEPLYLANDLNYWDRNKIRLVQYPSASEVLRAFRNQTLDAASLTLDEVLQLRQLDIPVTVVLVHDISHGADAIIAHSDIPSMAQLKGKKIAVESGALGAYLITRALEINKMTVNDIVVSNVDYDGHEKVFLNKEVDAVVTFDPVKSRLIAKGAKQIFDSTMMPGEIVDVLVVRQDYLNQYPQNLHMLVDGWFRSLDYIMKYRQDAYARMATRLQVSPQEVEQSLKGIQLPDREMNSNMLSAEGNQLQATAVRLNKVLYDNKLISRLVLDHNFMTDQFIRSDQ